MIVSIEFIPVWPAVYQCRHLKNPIQRFLWFPPSRLARRTFPCFFAKFSRFSIFTRGLPWLTELWGLGVIAGRFLSELAPLAG